MLTPPPAQGYAVGTISHSGAPRLSRGFFALSLLGLSSVATGGGAAYTGKITRKGNMPCPLCGVVDAASSPRGRIQLLITQEAVMPNPPFVPPNVANVFGSPGRSEFWLYLDRDRGLICIAQENWSRGPQEPDIVEFLPSDIPQLLAWLQQLQADATKPKEG